MNFPIPPTDNLYKFSALFGIIIVFASYYLLFTLLNELIEKTELAELKIATANANMWFLERKIKSVSEIINNSIAIRNGQWKPDSTKLELSYSETELKSLILLIDDLTNDLKVSIVEVKHYEKKSTRLLKDFKLVYWWMGFWIFVGCALAIFGFLNWYYRNQIYQDKVLKNCVSDQIRQSKGDTS